jgi:hypothetical protein
VEQPTDYGNGTHHWNLLVPSPAPQGYVRPVRLRDRVVSLLTAPFRKLKNSGWTVKVGRLKMDG